MRILVTGGAGFIGSHIVEHFNTESPATEVVVLDNLSTGNIKNLEGRAVTFIEGDVTDRDAVQTAMDGCEFVFHLAAMVSVIESMDNPTGCIETNVQGTLKVMKTASEAGVKKVIFSSSCAVYGDTEELPLRETTPPRPLSPYALSKWDGEQLMLMFRDVWGVDCGLMRYFNVYGPRQNPQSDYAAAIPIFITRALNGDDINIYGDGSQTRDFVYVKDVVRANVHMMHSGPGPFNVGTGESISIQTLAEQIAARTGSSSSIVNVAPRPGEVLHSCSNIDALKKSGLNPSVTLSEGLDATIAYFREIHA
ncbi:MAG: NAD-dependent epimerase/dehydratase family protein [Verrucomicrobia bacterium]|nr:NAD-dependent epimerase/dehydratase family protein [Verrucomicrobiota bacterium]